MAPEVFREPVKASRNLCAANSETAFLAFGLGLAKPFFKVRSVSLRLVGRDAAPI